MKNRRGSEKRVMDKAVLVRLDDTLFELLNSAAKDEACSRADFVRAVLRAQLERHSFSVCSDSRKIRTELAAVGTHLGRLTGALVQSAKLIRQAKVSPALHSSIEVTITEARTVQARLLGLLQELSK